MSQYMHTRWAQLQFVQILNIYTSQGGAWSAAGVVVSFINANFLPSKAAKTFYNKSIFLEDKDMKIWSRVWRFPFWLKSV